MIACHFLYVKVIFNIFHHFQFISFSPNFNERNNNVTSPIIRLQIPQTSFLDIPHPLSLSAHLPVSPTASTLNTVHLRAVFLLKPLSFHQLPLHSHTLLLSELPRLIHSHILSSTYLQPHFLFS